MTIENTLERIAVALEALAAGGSVPVAALPVAAPPVVPPVVPPVAPPVAPQGLPPNVTPMAPPPPPPAAPPAAQTASLDDIRAAANDFHRAHPDRAAEVVAILAAAGARKMTEIPATHYNTVLGQLKALGA